MPIRLEFTLTFDDYLNAVRLNATRNWWTRFCLVFQEFVALILGILIGLYAVIRAVHGEMGIPFIVMIGAAIYLVAWLNPRTRLKQIYRQSSAANGEALEFNEIEIRLQGSNWQAEYRWAAVSSFSEGDRILLLDLAPCRSIVIPKRVCTSDQLERLRDLFATKIAPKRSPQVVGHSPG
jgi:hypothetical protein